MSDDNEHVLSPLDPSNRQRLEKRKAFPGADSHNALFDEAERDLRTSVSRLATSNRRVRASKEGVIHVARRIQSAVGKVCPDWGRDMQRVATASLVLYRLRSSDVASPELVQIVWACLGDVRLRSHKGMVHFYDVDSSFWRRYTGLFPEGVFVFLRDFMNKVEGCFRSFEGKVAWNQEGVLHEIKRIVDSTPGATPMCKQSRALEDFKNVSFWNKGDGKAPKRTSGDAVMVADGGDDIDGEAPVGQDEGESAPNRWYLTVARNCKTLTPRMVTQLLSGGAVVKNFAEWCETGDPRISGVVYRDRAVVYDVGGQPVRLFESPQASDNFYVGMPSSLFQTSNEDDLSETEGPQIPLSDPYLQTAQEEVNLFLRQTFWCNHAGLVACRAALAIAKRGLNVVQCFIFYGAGGCGLSLFTELLATSLGEDLHKYYDPFLFYEEDELRKTVELLTGGIVFSGQERPQGTKRSLLVHLWKKFLSGEGLRGRLPYAILTRMIRLSGWVRMEVNSVLPFGSLTEGEFESIMRRSCVIKIFARFFDKQYLERHLQNHEELGIFSRNPELPAKFQSLPYAAAWNRTQHVFEEKMGVDQCRDIIAEFTRNGGDHGVTEHFMRDSCRLPRRGTAEQANAQGTLAGVTVDTNVAEAFMQTEKPPVSGDLKTFSNNLMRELIDRNLDSWTPSYFNQKSRQVPGCSLNRSQLYQELVRTGLWQRVGSLHHKQKDAIMPVIPCSVALRSLIPPLPESEREMSFPEVVHAKRLSDAFGKDTANSHNMTVLRTVMEELLRASPATVRAGAASGDDAGSLASSISKGGVAQAARAKGRPKKMAKVDVAQAGAAGGGSFAASSHERAMQPVQDTREGSQIGGATELAGPGRGRLSQEERDYKEKLKKTLSKLGETASLATLAETQVAPRTPTGNVQDSPTRTRRTGKPKNNHVMSHDIVYRPCRPWPSRDIARGQSPGQRLPQFAQVLVAPQTEDIDIANCMFTVLPQLLRGLQIDSDIALIFKPELDLLEDLRTQRDELCSDVLQANVSEGKKILNAVAMGGTMPRHRFNQNQAALDLLDRVVKVGRFVRWVACSCMPDELQALIRDPKVDWPASSCAAHFWQGAEAAIMRRFLDFARQKPLRHLSLQFDGVRIDQARLFSENDDSSQGSCEAFLAAAGDYVASHHAGIVVEFKVKEHPSFLQLLTRSPQDSAHVSNIDVPDWFLTRNSVLQSLWGLIREDEAAVARFRSSLEGLDVGQLDSIAQGRSTLRTITGALRMKAWRPYLGPRLDFVGKCILLFATESEPGCCGIHIMADDTIRLFFFEADVQPQQGQVAIFPRCRDRPPHDGHILDAGRPACFAPAAASPPRAV